MTANDKVNIACIGVGGKGSSDTEERPWDRKAYNATRSPSSSRVATRVAAARRWCSWTERPSASVSVADPEASRSTSTPRSRRRLRRSR